MEILYLLDSYFSNSNLLRNVPINRILSQTDENGYLPLINIIGQADDITKKPIGKLKNLNPKIDDIILLEHYAENWELN